MHENDNEDFDKLRSNITLAEATEGWNRLSEKQQKMIKASLHIQRRAERTDDPLSKYFLVFPENSNHPTIVHGSNQLGDIKRNSENPDHPIFSSVRKYALSQDMVADFYCHQSVYKWESEDTNFPDEKEVPYDFFYADYERSDMKKLVDRITRVGFPCVLIASENRVDKENPPGLYAKHSCVLLGNVQGKIIVWEKMGATLPFRITTLDMVKANYDDPQMYWGVRSLKVREDYGFSASRIKLWPNGG